MLAVKLQKKKDKSLKKTLLNIKVGMLIKYTINLILVNRDIYHFL